MLLPDVLIVDATDRLGWLAGRLLADLGAEVIKIEACSSSTRKALPSNSAWTS
jgi:crotonobetainyl-CoA:carnitine CoA-transferase CaiB-like acyl-CoA transferase